MADSEGPVRPDAVESVGDVAAAGAADHDGSDDAGVPTDGVAVSVVAAAAVIALGVAVVILIGGLVEALVVGVVSGESLHRERDECRRRLALVKCCQFVYRFRFVHHVTIHLPLLARYGDGTIERI